MPSHRVQTEELSLVIGDNAADGDHQAGYNGIWDLRSVHDEAPFFVPPYCGMNFEFIAPKAREDPTEPKDHPTQLSIEGDEVVLHQGSTPTHAVESWMRYRPSGPAHIDWTFRYKLHDPGAFSTGVAGFFFASYIDRPENKAIYVLSRDVYDAMMWVQYCTTFQGVESAIVWEGDDYDLTFGDCEHGLYTSRAPIRYAVPLMLGRRGAMAFCLMFADPAGVVISHGMGGGGFVPDESDRNPAWDFFLYVRDPQVYAEGEWRGRLVYKKFAGRGYIARIPGVPARVGARLGDARIRTGADLDHGQAEDFLLPRRAPSPHLPLRAADAPGGIPGDGRRAGGYDRRGHRLLSG